MARAFNTATIQSAAASGAAVGRDCEWITFWSAQNGGNLYDRRELSNNPSALQIGERFEFPAGDIEIIQPGYKVGTSLPANPVLGQVFQFSAAATGLANTREEDGTTALTTAAVDDVFVWNGTVWILQADNEPLTYETEIQAARALGGRIAGGMWLQYHDGNPGADGTANVIPVIGRTQWEQSNITVENS